MNDPSPDPTRRLLTEITALIDGHRRRDESTADVRRNYESHPQVHQAPPAPVTVFTGNPRIGTLITGNSNADARWSPMHRALQTARTRLPELDLEPAEERALDEQIETALDETVRVQPRRRRLRRLVGGICAALVSGIATGATKPAASELVAELQRALP